MIDRIPFTKLVTITMAVAVVAGITIAVAAGVWSYVHIDNNNGMSNSSVNVIFQDGNDIMWIGTWDGLNRYDGNHIVQYRAISRDTTTLSNPVVRNIIEEDYTYLWVVTDMGINRLDRRTGTFRRYYLDNGTSRRGYVEKSFHCAYNGDGLLLACRDGGRLLRFNRERQSFDSMPMTGAPRESVRQMSFSDRNHLILVTDHWMSEYALTAQCQLRLMRRARRVGLTVFDRQGHGYVQMGKEIFRLTGSLGLQRTGIMIDGTLTAVSAKAGQMAVATTDGYYLFARHKPTGHYMNGTGITALCFGTQGILWAGTDGKGLFQFYNKTNSILTYRIGRHESAVRAITRMGRRMLVGTKGEGLFVYHMDKSDSLLLRQNINVGPGRTHNAVFALAPSLDSTRVWVGTDGVGLSFYAGDALYRMDLSRLRHGEAAQLRSIYSIVQSDDSTLFLATSGHGVLRVRFSQNTITGIMSVSKLLPKTAAADIVYTQVLDGPYLWFGARESGLFRLDTRTMRCRHFTSSSTDGQLISNDVISLHKANDGKLWVGTSQGLCYLDESSGRDVFHWVGGSAPDGIMNVHNIQEDIRHNIWVSTSNGVCLVLNNLSTVNLTYRDGLQGNEFADGAGCAFDGGRLIYFGGTKGMNVIDVSAMHSGGTIPPLTLQEVTIDGKRTPTDKGIRLGLKAGSICFSFSIPDYINNDRCLLSYSLTSRTLFFTDEQPNWQMGSPDKTVTLNELPPGDYVLKVRQSNFSQQWASHCMEIPFHVDYPLWQRWWAVVAYIVLLSVLIRSVYLRKKRRLIRRHKRELEKQNERTREDIYHAKLRFFSSVTRAFSGNITQIFDALSNIRKNPSGDTDRDLSIIDQNIRSMSTHIRQISEIRSTEENLPLTPARVNLYDLVITSTENYVERMLKAGIFTEADETMRGMDVVTDRQTFTKALYYLLEYVFRNIADGSRLSIGAKVSGRTVEMVVDYQGSGPSEEELTEIFNSHKAVDQFENDQAGVGRIIGVTISNGLLKRLGGGLSITRSSEEDDHMQFHLSIEQMELLAMPQQQNDTVVDRIIRNKDKRVWLIKCDATMIDFSRRALGDQYDIVTSCLEETSGKGVAEEVDLIVCELSGQDYDFITRLRADLRTQYVPILAVCDEGARESYAEVLTMGVNTLIERPFTAQYFKTVVDHSVLDTQRMRDFSTSVSAYTQRFDALGLNEKDRKFIYQTVDTLRQHFSDESYTPDQLAKDMAISRSQLYRKMRELTKVSPGDFILEYRLIHAEMLLKTTELTVSEIINACGFRNRSFFYRAFGRRNHCLPMEFRKKETKIR